MIGMGIIETAALTVSWVRSSNIQAVHWPPQPTTIAGVAIIGAGLFLAPELVWPALITGLVAILGDDGTRPKNEEAEG